MNNTKPHRHLFIATPSHAGKVRCEYVESLMMTLGLLAQNGIQVSHFFIMGNAIIQDVRNQLVAQFMVSDATDLLFIDDDISWEPAAALRLAMSPHDVIGGACRKKLPEEIYNVGAAQLLGTGGLVECDYIGTGFLKIKRKAILKMTADRPGPDYLDEDGNECYMLFDVQLVDGRLVGEDILFCQRWRAMGGKVFIDPDMNLCHHGSQPYPGNYLAMAVSKELAA